MVIDEFSYLIEGNPELPSLIQQARGAVLGIDEPRLAVKVNAFVGGTPAYRREFIGRGR